MEFEKHENSADLSKNSSSLFHEAMDHVRNTWSNVMSGNASAAEYAEAAVEAAVCVAGGAIALKYGARFLGLESRAASAGANFGARTAESVGLTHGAAEAARLGQMAARESLPAFGNIALRESAPMGIRPATDALVNASIPINPFTRGIGALTDAAIPIRAGHATDALINASIPINPATRRMFALTEPGLARFNPATDALINASIPINPFTRAMIGLR